MAKYKTETQQANNEQAKIKHRNAIHQRKKWQKSITETQLANNSWGFAYRCVHRLFVAFLPLIFTCLMSVCCVSAHISRFSVVGLLRFCYTVMAKIT
jgi:hypothetical protein